jgi:N-acetylglucosaminyl-diphospho-decaprenol L-rhamnosyltransferase
MDLAGLSAPSAAPPAPLPQRQDRRRPTLDVPRLSIVIVNYCEWQSTAALVRQLLRAPATRRGLAEVVVVDNHSPSHPLVRRLRRLPSVSLRRWRRNHGFARAANEGCRLSQGDWVLLLNPDVTLAPDFLDQALALIEEMAGQEPRAGVIGVQLRNSDGTAQLSAGPFPTLTGSLARLALPRHRRKYHALQPARRARVPWVTGCCLLLRKQCLQEMNGFDEEFFLYYEDVDFCRRALGKHWSVWYEPRLHAVHHQPLHTRTVPSHLRLITRHALLTYSTRHWPAWQSQVLAGMVRLEARLRRTWANWRGDAQAADHFQHLEALARELASGNRAAARRRLRRIVEQVRPATVLAVAE